jgi:hypothetical protein
MSTRLVNWALRAHPARYRDRLGPELADAALASMAGRGRGGAAAEAASLAAHGLRLRLRLGADRLPGRALAAAAPLALTLSAVGTLADRIAQARMFGRVLDWGQLERAFGVYPALAGAALAALGALALLLGRVTAARLLATGSAAAALTAAAISLSYTSAHGGLTALALAQPVAALGPLLAAALLWAAPLRLLPAPGNTAAWLVAGTALTAFTVLRALPGSNVWAVADLALLLTAALPTPRTREPALTSLLALLTLCPTALYRLAHDGSAFANRVTAGAATAALLAAALLSAARWTPFGRDTTPATNTTEPTDHD